MRLLLNIYRCLQCIFEGYLQSDFKKDTIQEYESLKAYIEIMVRLGISTVTLKSKCLPTDFGNRFQYLGNQVFKIEPCE